MTERERLLSVLSGRTPDRTPWFGDLSWWYTARLRAGDLPEAYREGDAGYLRLYQDAGVGIYLYAPMLWTETYDESVTVETVAEGDLVTSTVHTPAGTLRQVVRDLPESATTAIIEHYVKGAEDLGVVRYLWQHRRIRENTAAFSATDALWGAQGLACALGPVCTSALQNLLARWCGVETTVELLCSEHCAEVELTMRVMQEADDPIFRILAEAPCPLVVFPENLSAEVTGSRLARRYLVPYWRKRIEELHAAGKWVGIHNDGTLRGSLPWLIEAGFDVVESATPAPVGDIGLGELRSRTDGHITVWGGLPGALFSPIYPEAEFAAFVQTVLETFPRGSAFVLGVADQVPPDASFDRIRLVREIVDAHA